MHKKYYLLILLSFLMTSCSHLHKKTPLPAVNAPTSMSSTQTRSLAAFNLVDVQGRLNINLHTGYKKPQLILRGDPRDLMQVQTKVQNDTLYISLGSGYPQHGEVSVDVQGRFLNKFRYEGAGIVTGNRLNTRFLDLYLANQGTTRLGGSLGVQELVVKGNGLVQLSGVTSYNMQIHLIGSPKVQINGTVNLAELNISGGGWLSLYWVKSNNLLIKAKNTAKIQLAGIANRLEVELWGTAQFKGRYLRAQRSFVKTHDKSVAEIASVNHQSSLSTDASDIYYYNIPNTRADFMGFDGSTLDMRDLTSPYLNQEYTRYNKHFP
ncbi:GIN domain-containing protein [Legionella sp. km772]|uniref:GIN domain-containing protein n=1 Tax=Legionella sp. km772 TaxID=2498111 RepID=UPI000F8D7DFA|nr:DUF2807 domain-containing protein [Legionella sp. km772]RUR13830.1 hypothetical protein ELY15_01380 [Legionella sp. km772]